jgi:hypothetical protein
MTDDFDPRTSNVAPGGIDVIQRHVPTVASVVELPVRVPLDGACCSHSLRAPSRAWDDDLFGELPWLLAPVDKIARNILKDRPFVEERVQRGQRHPS